MQSLLIDATSDFFFIVGLVFVDCTASSDTIVVLKQVVDLGCCVVMANKKPLTSTMVRSLQLFHYDC
jgi:homoserine dehydrogenase